MTQSRNIDSETVRASLRKILESETFSRSERLRAFLDYVVRKEQEGLAHQLKGYTIGVDVFARTESFDPGGDPLVRVQAGKLRKLLQQYYIREGTADEIEIRVPVGTYVPVYQRPETPEAVEPTAMPAVDAAAMAKPADDQGNAGWNRFRFASTSLLAVTVLNITALGLHATSRYLVPNENIAISSKTSFYRDASALPRVMVANRFEASTVAAPLADAVRLAAAQIVSIDLVSGFDRANAVSRQDSRLDFTLSVSPDDSKGHVLLALHHNATGRLVHSETTSEDKLHSVSERIYAATSFTGRALAMNGQLYAFSDGSAYSSRLMRCLTATYEYRQQKSREAFETALGCQSELIPNGEPSRFISELETLTSTARDVEAASLTQPGA